MPQIVNREAMTNCLLGGALGDSIGLPAEGIPAKRIARLWPGPQRHRFLFGGGMVSDDTEHAVMTALSLAKHGADPERFARDLARRLRWWFAGIPAGIGLGTARSILKLWCGITPSRSGVGSAGNGPMMRAAVIGVHFADNEASRRNFTDASTHITHSDARAAEGARMISAAAAMACKGMDNAAILDQLGQLVESAEIKVRFPLLREALAARSEVGAFADSFGRKPGFVSGFAPDSAAVALFALFAWLRHRGDFRATIEFAVKAGGDTDTVAFIAGSLAGIETGREGMPAEWLTGLRDWPIHPAAIQRLGGTEPPCYPVWPLSLIRNFFFLIIVLIHGFRRLLPPY
jgi:ADP-ribosylglycohydrolase